MEKDIRIPKKITPDPILESVVELRFKTNLPSDAIFGMLYNKLNEMFPNSYESLPILQLPEAVRLQDKNLEFSPHHKFKNENFQVNIGPKVIAIISLKPYSGWKAYFSVIESIIKYVIQQNFIQEVSRIGVRYIDFFEEINIFDHLKFKMDGFPFPSKQSSYTTAFQYEKFMTNLQVSNSSQILIKNKVCNGSIFDTDTYIETNIPVNKSDILDIISNAHTIEKKIFYSLIKDSFIQTLNPEYD